MDIQMINALADALTQIVFSMLPSISAYMIENSSFLIEPIEVPVLNIDDVNYPTVQRQKYTNIDYSRIDSEKIRSMMTEFSKTLIKNFPEDALINFYNNINEVNIRKNILILLSSTSGLYYEGKNQIRYAISSSVYHELFHMASSYYDPRTHVFYSGFRQVHNLTQPSKRTKIGEGITEGYTELLAHRYFDNNKKMPWSYNFETKVMSFLEDIIDSKKLEKLYLKADLMGFINSLEKYISDEEILSFISSVDYINKYAGLITVLKNTTIQEYVRNAYQFLLKAYMIKQKQLYENGEIDAQTFMERAYSYFFKINISTIVAGHSYNHLDNNSLQEIYEEVVNNPTITSPKLLKR